MRFHVLWKWCWCTVCGKSMSMSAISHHFQRDNKQNVDENPRRAIAMRAQQKNGFQQFAILNILLIEIIFYWLFEISIWNLCVPNECNVSAFCQWLWPMHDACRYTPAIMTDWLLHTLNVSTFIRLGNINNNKIWKKTLGQKHSLYLRIPERLLFVYKDLDYLPSTRKMGFILNFMFACIFILNACLCLSIAYSYVCVPRTPILNMQSISWHCALFVSSREKIRNDKCSNTIVVTVVARHYIGTDHFPCCLRQCDCICIFHPLSRRCFCLWMDFFSIFVQILSNLNWKFLRSHYAYYKRFGSPFGSGGCFFFWRAMRKN